MKIAYIMSHRELNGVTASGTAQIRHLLSRGHEVHLVHRPGAWIGKQDFSGDIHHHAVDMGRKLPNRRSLDPVRKRLAAAGVEVAYSHGTQANIVGVLWQWQGLCPVIAKAAARIWHPHWRLQDGVIAPSQYTADWFLKKRLVRPDRIHVVPNFVRTEDVVRRNAESRAAARAEMGLDDATLAMTVIGKVIARKNQAAILPLLQGLRDRGITATVKLIGGAGGDYAKALRRDAEAAGLDGSVDLMGHRDDARRLLPGFDALICTSHDEQGPVAVIEAMAAGVPSVSTPVGMVPTLIEPGVNGEVLDLADPGRAVDYLARLAGDPAEAERQGAAARRTFEERLAPDSIVDRMEEVFARVANSAR
jgi:glycosyltransferase involved in cell wall biosynthesis